jgi:hypothetical protein
VQQEGVALDSAGEVQIDKRPKLVVLGVVGGAGRTFFEGLEVDKAGPVLVHEGAEGQTIGPTGGKVANVHPRIPRCSSLAPVFILIIIIR